MKIEVLYIKGCPSFPVALELVTRLLRKEDLRAPVEVVSVSSHEEAVRYRFLGSPTIRINGEDVEVAARQRQDFGLNCRLYSVAGRLNGVPDERTVRSAIQEARRQQLGALGAKAWKTNK